MLAASSWNLGDTVNWTAGLGVWSNLVAQSVSVSSTPMTAATAWTLTDAGAIALGLSLVSTASAVSTLSY